jgi:gas vesicle protein
VSIKDKARLLGAMAAGAALGAVVGLLMAPASGRRTRRRLARAFNDGRDAMVRSGDNLIDWGKRVVNG